MNSVYGKLLLWSLGAITLGFLALIGVGMLDRERGRGPGNLDALFLDQTLDAYRAGGPQRLQAELARIGGYLRGAHYLVDDQGRDLANGQDRSALLSQPRVMITRSPDGHFVFLTVFEPHYDFRGMWPYHALFILVLAILCGALAANLASPLRQLARAVDRFGGGDLSVRVNSTRKDEIGEVSRAFDRMAERISTLLTAERRLLQDISHELRSPLARLSFAAELARTAPDRNAAVGRLNKEIGRLTDLVGGLIQVTRAEGDPSANRTDAIWFDQLVSEVVEDCRMEADQRGCTLTYEMLGVKTFGLQGDRELLRRAVENVLRNAIRYTPGGTAIEVALGRSENLARLSIRDHGPGVPQEALGKIFQPFFRLDDSRDSSTGGVGLGLAIAQRAITLHRGTLWAENASPGLKVWIELPLSAS